MAIKNHRCLRDVDIRFDDITTFIGPNGMGKSATLRAGLDLQLPAQPVTEQNVWAGTERKQIAKAVEDAQLATQGVYQHPLTTAC